MSVPGADPAASLYSRPFVLLCFSSLAFYLSFQLLTAVVPLYAASLGVRDAQIGLLIGAFAGAAMLLRPVAGRLADRVGRVPLIAAGPAIFAVATLAYPAVGGLGTLLALRVFHGIGMGLGPTAATTMVADLAPGERRGEAMGVFGVTTTAGIAVGPYLGVELMRAFGYATAFAVSAGVAVIGFLIARTLPETRPRGAGNDAPGPPGARWGRRPLQAAAGLFSPRAVYPSLLLLALYFGFGGVIAFLPLFARVEHLGNPGLFFAAYAVAVILVRAWAGRLADRFGRRIVTAPGLVLAGVALAVLAGARTPARMALAAALYGAGLGLAQPALMAMTADRVGPEERGRAMGTFYTAWELGIGGGAVVLGQVAARLGYPAMWWIAALAAWLGALASLRGLTRLRG